MMFWKSAESPDTPLMDWIIYDISTCRLPRNVPINPQIRKSSEIWTFTVDSAIDQGIDHSKGVLFLSFQSNSRVIMSALCASKKIFANEKHVKVNVNSF